MTQLKTHQRIGLAVFLCAALIACNDNESSVITDESASDDSTNDNVTVDNTIQGNAGTPGVLHDAYMWFDGNVTVALDGFEVVVEATGRPDHTSPYWNPDNSSGLYVAADPDITTVSQMSPGYIEDYNNLYTLRVPTSPSLASNTSATSLGAVGIAVSGTPIFNDQEGPNNNLDIGVISGFDSNGAHTGPETYHYHLEPKAITNDDDELVGVIADGFFLYGRKCFATPDAYPSDLDVSGGHFSITEHSNGVEEFHYHIKNELYLSSYYILFPEDYQGTPNSVSR